MRRIRLTEGQFNQLVAKCVKRALYEAEGKDCENGECKGKSYGKGKKESDKVAQPKKTKSRQWKGNREELDDLIGGNPMDFDMGEIEGYY